MESATIENEKRRLHLSSNDDGLEERPWKNKSQRAMVILWPQLLHRQLLKLKESIQFKLNSSTALFINVKRDYYILK